MKLNDVLVPEVRDVLKLGWYFRLTSTGNQYQIIGFKTDTTDTVLIDSWSSGDGSGLTGTVLQRLISEANGIFNYKGMYIEKPSVLPTFADPNSNTALENNTFKENYLLVIGDYTYSILEEFSESSVDYLRIAGVPVSWGTFLSGGTTVSVDTNQIQKIAADIQGHSVARVDRAGLDDYAILTEVSSSFMFLPQSKKDDGISDNVQQEEKVSFTIEYKNGTKQEGEIQ